MNIRSLQEASKTVTFMLYKYTVSNIFICYNRFSFQIHVCFQSFYSPSNPEKSSSIKSEQLFLKMIIRNIDQQISILEWFLKDRLTHKLDFSRCWKKGDHERLILKPFKHLAGSKPFNVSVYLVYLII